MKSKITLILASAIAITSPIPASAFEAHTSTLNVGESGLINTIS